MRLNTCSYSDASWAEVSTRCSVWQPTHWIMNCFCWSEPGRLLSHSPLESVAARLRALPSLRSAVAVEPAVTPVALAPTIAEPAARILIVYLPGASRIGGKL